MYKHLKTIVIVLAAVIAAGIIAIPVLAAVTGDQAPSQNAPAPVSEVVEDVIAADSAQMAIAQTSEKASKSYSAAAVVGVVAAVGALSMGLAISKAVESVARQPEAGSKVQTMLMLGLVFIETAIIYALIVAILIIFVL